MSARLLMAAALLLWLGLTIALSQAELPPIAWIPWKCCVTNNCCFQIEPTEVRSLPADNWLIIASGQILKRTGWSPDGKYWRCACDWIDNKWVVHAKAETRCIFPPLPMM